MEDEGTSYQYFESEAFWSRTVMSVAGTLDKEPNQTNQRHRTIANLVPEYRESRRIQRTQEAAVSTCL